MANPDILLRTTRESGKTYSFRNNGNPRIVAEYWFQTALEGKTLFLVFYTQACRYSKCSACNLPSKMSQYHIGFSDIMRQVDSVFDHILSPEDKLGLKKIIVSNNGSVLDEETFSTTALLYLVAKINLECPNVRVVSLETRPEYVDMEELEVLNRALCEGTTPSALEIVIGFEAFDDRIRNEFFRKGLKLSTVEHIASMIGEINQRFEAKRPNNYQKMRLKTYFMLKPVSGISDTEAIADIHRGIDFLHTLATKYDIDINMHLNPTYVAKGTLLEEEFYKGLFTPPTLDMVANAVRGGRGKRVSIFVGLNDEGLAVENGSFYHGTDDEKEILLRLEQFNATQDYTLVQ
jgi:hypothetical protein